MSIDKGLTKVPLMHEPRGIPGSRISNGIQLLPKQTGSIAPDHPPKQTQAWVRFHFFLHLCDKTEICVILFNLLRKIYCNVFLIDKRIFF